MKRMIKDFEALNTIQVTVYLHPIFYASSELFGSVTLDKDTNKYNTDVNPDRINGPLSDYGEELEAPLKDELDKFIEDCKWLINELGFTIITSQRSEDSKKSEYIIMFGIGDTPCRRLVYDLRISDHPFDATFPEQFKQAALEYLKINNILDGTATAAGIDFQVEKVTVGSVKEDTWNRAFLRLQNKLKQIKSKIKIRLNK